MQPHQKVQHDAYELPTQRPDIVSDRTDGPVEMNDAAKQTVAAEFIQRRWREKCANHQSTAVGNNADGATLPSDGKQSAGLGGTAAATDSGAPQVDKMPEGLTKMQQVAWKRKHREN
ncbi:hypothetical protein N9K47_00195 [bacterium]|nr:hypothetical protein [bacterium]